MKKTDRSSTGSNLQRRQVLALLAAFGVTPEALAQDAAVVAPRSFRVALRGTF